MRTPRDFSIFGAPVVLQGAMGLYGRSGLADRLPPPANVVISNVPGPADRAVPRRRRSC